MEFKIGDRVVGVGIMDSVDIEGKSGEIIRLRNDRPDLCGVKFDKRNMKFHDLDKHCPDGYGWWVNKSKLIPAKITNWRKHLTT